MRDCLIDELYYDEEDAVSSAKQIAVDTKEIVTIWVADDIEGFPIDALVWSVYKIIWN